MPGDVAIITNMEYLLPLLSLFMLYVELCDM